jgi:hypothetical protein
MRKRSDRRSTKRPDFTAEITFCLPAKVTPEAIRFLFGSIGPNGDKLGGRVFVGGKLARSIAEMASQNGRRVAVVGNVQPNDERHRDNCPFKLRSISNTLH